MTKIKHKYFSNGQYPINSIAFKIKAGSSEYGYFIEHITKWDRFRQLRNLVLNKHKMIDALKIVGKL